MAIFLILWISGIISAIFLRKSFDKIAELMKVDLFKTTGTLNLIGAVTAIILVGFLIQLVAVILQVISFFSL